MRQSILLFLSIFYFNNIFTQEHPIEIQTELFDLGKTEWQPVSLEKYSPEGQLTYFEIHYYEWSSDFNTHIYGSNYKDYVYDEHNNLTYASDNFFYFYSTVEGEELEEIFYVYDANNNLIYDSLLLDTVPKNINHHHYNDQNQIIAEEYYIYVNGEKELSDSISYFYENDCLIRKDSINYLEGRFKRTYEYYNNCLLKKSKLEKWDDSNAVFLNLLQTTYEYHNDLISYRKVEEFKSSNNTWVVEESDSTIYSNTDKPLIYYRKLNVGPYLSERIIFSLYNEKDSLVCDTHFKKSQDGEIHLVKKDSIEYIFDKNNFLIQKKLIQYSSGQNPTTFIMTIYNNFCDGLVKTETINDLSEGYIQKIYYKYLHPTTCHEDSLNYQLNIFPNPTTGIVKINSNLLSAENNQIRIFTSDGKIIKTLQVETRTEEIEIDLSDLANGFYFIEVKNPSGRLTEKVIIAK